MIISLLVYLESSLKNPTPTTEKTRSSLKEQKQNQNLATEAAEKNRGHGGMLKIGRENLKAYNADFTN
ncbi:MAG TPA: hypothetical protein VI636_23250 [Candidatus Angelobacter sp.]